MSTPGHRAGALTRGDLKRIDKRTQRRLARNSAALDADAIDATRTNLIGTISRKIELCQRAEAGLLAAADLGATVDGLAKFAVQIWNSTRRDQELLLMVEREVASRAGNGTGTKCATCSERFADLTAYVAHKATCVAAAVHSSSVHSTASDAAAPPACSIPDDSNGDPPA